MELRRVVVTGLGLVTPLGCGVEATWANLLAGKSGAKRIDDFQVDDIACQIAHRLPLGPYAEGKYDPDDWMDVKEQRKVDPFIVYAMAAATQAIQDAGVEPKTREDQERTGVLIGSGIGGVGGIYDASITLHEKGPRRISPFFIPGRLINLASGHVSIRFGLKGPNHSVVTACSTGAHAIGDAARLIALGDADVMVAGGAEFATTPTSVGGFCSMKALSTRNDDPTGASRPWDVGRDGFVMGDGAGVLVLEEYERAKARGARIYAELAGFGMSGDAYHMTAPSENGEGGGRCMRAAINDAGIDPSQIGYINAHGTSTPAGDLAETMGIKGVLGDHASKVMVSSTKSMTGHLLGAAGGVEAVFSVMALHTGVIPPTINLDTPDVGCDLDYVPHTAREHQVEYVMSNSFGFGGTNGSLVFRRV